VVGLSVQPGVWLGEDRQDDWVVGGAIEARGVALGIFRGRGLVQRLRRGVGNHNSSDWDQGVRILTSILDFFNSTCFEGWADPSAVDFEQQA